MGLETALQEAMASIDAGKEIAKENAEVLAVALQKPKSISSAVKRTSLTTLPNHSLSAKPSMALLVSQIP